METDTNSHSDTAADPRDAESIGALTDALVGLYGACQLANLYPPGHPSVPRTAEKAIQEFDKVLADRESVVIGVTHDRLMFDSQHLGEASDALDDLAHMLHELDVAAIEFSVGLIAKELAACAQELTGATKHQLKGQKLADTIKEKQVDHIRLYPIDYRAVRFADGADQRRDDEAPAAELWKQMIRSLTDPTVDLTGDRIQQLADDVAVEIERHEGMGVNALRQQLHGAIQEAQAMPTDQRGVTHGRLATFVSALGPGLRDDILHVDGENPGPSLSIMGGLADQMPMDDLVEALKQVNRQCGRAPKELLYLVNKLVLITQQHPEDSQEIQDTLSRWGVPAQAFRGEDVDMQASLQEMFQFHSQTQFNPEGYQSQLDQLSRVNLTKIAQASVTMSNYSSMLDENEVRLRNVEIIAQLLEQEDEDPYNAGLLSYASDQTDLLFAHKRFALMHELVRLAQRHGNQDNCSQATRLAATGYLNDWQNPKRIGEILKSVTEGQEVTPEVIELLRLGKRAALHGVLDVIGSIHSPQAAQSLRLLVRDSGIEELSQVIDERSAGGWAALEPAFPILGQMTGCDSEPVLIQLSRHQDAQVRGEALAMLCRSTELSEAAQQQVYRALCDSLEPTQASAIDQLSRQKSPESIELLGAYIERSLPDQPPVTFHGRRAVRVLEGWGEEGLDRLCDALRTLSISPLPQNARLARIVAQSLESKRDTPAVNRVWKLWRFSPNRLVGFFTEDRTADGGQRS